MIRIKQVTAYYGSDYEMGINEAINEQTKRGCKLIDIKQSININNEVFQPLILPTNFFVASLNTIAIMSNTNNAEMEIILSAREIITGKKHPKTTRSGTICTIIAHIL